MGRFYPGITGISSLNLFVSVLHSPCRVHPHINRSLLLPPTTPTAAAAAANYETNENQGHPNTQGNDKFHGKSRFSTEVFNSILYLMDVVLERWFDCKSELVCQGFDYIVGGVVCNIVNLVRELVQGITVPADNTVQRENHNCCRKALTRAMIIKPLFLAHFSLFFSHFFRLFPYFDSKIRLGAHARNSTSFVNGHSLLSRFRLLGQHVGTRAAHTTTCSFIYHFNGTFSGNLWHEIPQCGAQFSATKTQGFVLYCLGDIYNPKCRVSNFGLLVLSTPTMFLLCVVLTVSMMCPVLASDTALMDAYNFAAKELGISPLTSALGIDKAVEKLSVKAECQIMKYPIYEKVGKYAAYAPLFREEPFSEWCEEYGPKNVIMGLWIFIIAVIISIVGLACCCCKCCYDILRCICCGMCGESTAPRNVVYLRMKEEGAAAARPQYEQGVDLGNHEPEGPNGAFLALLLFSFMISKSLSLVRALAWQSGKKGGKKRGNKKAPVVVVDQALEKETQLLAEETSKIKHSKDGQEDKHLEDRGNIQNLEKQEQPVAENDMAEKQTKKKETQVVEDEEDSGEDLVLDMLQMLKPEKKEPPVLVEDEEEDDEVDLVLDMLQLLKPTESKKVTQVAEAEEDDDNDDLVLDMLQMLQPTKKEPQIIEDSEDSDEDLVMDMLQILQPEKKIPGTVKEQMGAKDLKHGELLSSEAKENSIKTFISKNDSLTSELFNLKSVLQEKESSLSAPIGCASSKGFLITHPASPGGSFRPFQIARLSWQLNCFVPIESFMKEQSVA
eukprot:sb/3462256/